MKKRIKILLLALSLIGAAQVTSAQGLLQLGASRITGLPDTVRYGDTLQNLKVWIVNHGTLPLSSVIVQVMAVGSQGPAFQLGTLDLTLGLLAPGDSVEAPMDDYTVTPQNSSGGSNVILIWPTAPGTQPDDAANGSYWLDGVTGTHELSNDPSTILLYPNPGRDIFKLRHGAMPLTGGEIELFFPNGASATSRALDNSGILDFTALAEGLYYYRITLKGHITSTGKLLVQRN